MTDTKVCVYCGGDDHPAECGEPAYRPHLAGVAIAAIWSLAFWSALIWLAWWLA